MLDAWDDPRFFRGIQCLQEGEPGEAADCFEELFFEAVRDEVPFVRFFLQVSTGLHHIERGQNIGAAERLEEALKVLPEIHDHRGWDLERIARELGPVIEAVRRRSKGAREKISEVHVQRKDQAEPGT